MNKRAWIVIGGGVPIGALIAILTWASISTGGNPGGLAVNSDLIEFDIDSGVARDFELELIGGGSLKLSEHRGNIVMVDFWASWCAPCLISLPLNNDMYHRYKDQGLEVLASSVDNPVEEGLEFLEDTPLDFLIPSDPEGETAELFQVIGMPTSYLISHDGEVKLVHMGFRNGDMDIIEAAVKEVLEGN